VHRAQRARRGVTDPLGLDVERFRELGHLLVDRVAEHWAQIDDAPVVSVAGPEAIAALSGALEEQPQDIEELLETLAEDALAHMQHGAHPRFFTRVPSPASFAGILGEWLALGYNAIASSWAGGSGPSQLELVVLEWIRQLLGMPAQTEGVLVSGGSLGNLTALAAARSAGYSGRAYISDQTHASVRRALGMLGLGAEEIVLVPATDRHRWSGEELEAAILAEDRGRAIVIATAGTTNTGAVDRLDALADVCRERDLWLHVDGAYGAPAAFCEAGRAALQGIERADSLTLDPHKWLFQPYDIGCVLVRRAGALQACYGIDPEYLRDVRSLDAERVDLRDRGPELSRRARAAKLWLTLRAHGAGAIREAIARSIALAEAAQARLEQDPYWELVTPAQLGIVTFAAVGLSGPEHLERARRLTASGFAAVSCTELGGRTVYRLCLINPRTTLDEVQETLRRLAAAGAADP
jgi:aromatic-L-amino-acid decarboxylase